MSFLFFGCFLISSFSIFLCLVILFLDFLDYMFPGSFNFELLVYWFVPFCLLLPYWSFFRFSSFPNFDTLPAFHLIAYFRLSAWRI
jgi:hypothetical protein